MSSSYINLPTLLLPCGIPNKTLLKKKWKANKTPQSTDQLSGRQISFSHCAERKYDSFLQLRRSIYLESDTCGGIFPHQQHQSSSINTCHRRKHTMTHMRYKKHTHRRHESEWKREIRWNNWPFGIHSRDSTVHGEKKETHTHVYKHTQPRNITGGGPERTIESPACLCSVSSKKFIRRWTSWNFLPWNNSFSCHRVDGTVSCDRVKGVGYVGIGLELNQSSLPKTVSRMRRISNFNIMMSMCCIANVSIEVSMLTSWSQSNLFQNS